MFEQMKFRHFVGLSILFIIVGVILAAIISGGSEDAVGAGVNLSMYIITPIVFFGYHVRYRGFRPSRYASFKGVSSYSLPIVGIVLVGIVFSLSSFWLLITLLKPVIPSLVDVLLQEQPLPENSLFLIFEIITITILAPLIEEFVFRGVLLHRLMRKLSMWGGILISSLLFGILHADILGAFAFGIIASLLYLRTKNLMVPILMHALNNTLAVIFSYLPAEWLDNSLTNPDIDSAAFSLLPFSVLLISGAVSVYIIYRLSKGLSKRYDRSLEAEETASY